MQAHRVGRTPAGGGVYGGLVLVDRRCFFNAQGEMMVKRICWLFGCMLMLATLSRAETGSAVAADLEGVATQMAVEILSGNYKEAIAMGAPWMQKIDTIKPGETNAIFGLLNGLSYAYVKTNRLREAQETADVMLRLLSRSDGEVKEYGYLANIYDTFVAVKDYDRAEKLIVKKLELQKKAVGEKSREYAYTLSDLAELYAKKGDAANAEKTYLLAFALMTDESAPVEYAAAMIAEKISKLYQLSGRSDEAKSFANKAKEIRVEYDKVNKM